MIRDIFYQNEIELARSVFKSDYSDYVIIGEDGNYLFEALKKVINPSQNKKSDNFCVIGVLTDAENKENLIEKISDAASSHGCRKCVICDENTLDYSDGDIAFSEREFVFSVSQKNVIEKSKEISRKTSAILLVFDKIIGPGFGFEKDFEFSNDKISVTDDDTLFYQGYTYIRDALSAVLMSFSKLKDGNIYNVSSFTASAGEIKKKTHEIFNDKFSLECSLSKNNKKQTKSLCPLKIKASGLQTTDIKTALYAIVSSRFGFEYDYNKNLQQYCSKLDILKKTELDILKEIDRICKENGISYFLTGGTLLGAVRYGKSIPWDDDLDIGMLRSDFEKFRKICPNAIDKKRFAFASYKTEENCHYLFDKIRLKNTYFSTKFSSQYKIQDGVFVDIFVYDTTSPSVKKQKLHINLVKTAIRFLNVKWTGKADKSMNGYKLSLIIKPFIKLIPFKMLHMFSDKALMFYNKKKSDYLIDGTGLNINRGAFKKSCLEELSEIDFEGFTAPIPKNYDEFLKHVYGNNYLEEPPFFKRSGTHDFVRLDLGEYINGDTEVFSEQSLDGELF